MFTQYPAFRQLEQLSKTPVDLRSVTTPERMRTFAASGLGFHLLYSAERISLKELGALFDLAQEARALSKMEAMQQGVVINAIEGYDSENRSVLHTAVRNQFGHPLLGIKAQEAAQLAYRELQKLKHFLEKIEGDYTDLIQIGIGGSDLGPRALCMAVHAFKRPDRSVHFISNVDPDDINQVLEGLDLKKTLIVVVSKSGTTLETLTNETFIRNKIRNMGLDPKKHFVAVTKEKSPMDNPKEYLASFYIWDFVGGRYASTSMVGGVALSFAIGFEGFMEILKGASEMDQHALSKDPSQNLPLLSALLGIWNRNFLHLPTVAVIPYSQALIRFPAHLQQLDMESNGKQIDKEGNWCHFKTGPIIWGEPGTNGQHSFYQAIHQGTDVIPIEFIGFLKSQYSHDLEIEGTTSQQKLLANLFAQSLALATGEQNDNPNQVFLGNRPNRILLAERLDPLTLGKLLAYYEHKVAFQGFIWGINSFDQEGVQLGKRLANKILDQWAMKKDPPSFPLSDALFSFLQF